MRCLLLLSLASSSLSLDLASSSLSLDLASSSLSLDPRGQFESFKLRANRTYSGPAEEEMRFGVFQKNLRKMETHNSQGHSWTMGVTKFADLTRTEFVSSYASGRVSFPQGPSLPRRREVRLEDLPEAVDWRDKGVITPVRDQGMCGSCWAFSAASNIASYSKINGGGTLQELSVQHLVDCTPNPLHCGGTGGCVGAVPQLAYTYASLFGVVTETEYEYTGSDSECQFDARKTDVSATTMGFETLPHNDYLATLDHLANVGPISTSVAAGDWGMYFGGVFDGCSYDESISVNHAVQLVGYGTDPTAGDYWLIKNSWGTFWGEGWGGDGNNDEADQGYMRIKRDSGTLCGTNDYPLDGSSCADGGVESVHVCGQCAILSDNSYPVGAAWK